MTNVNLDELSRAATQHGGGALTATEILASLIARPAPSPEAQREAQAKTIETSNLPETGGFWVVAFLFDPVKGQPPGADGVWSGVARNVLFSNGDRTRMVRATIASGISFIPEATWDGVLDPRAKMLRDAERLAYLRVYAPGQPVDAQILPPAFCTACIAGYASFLEKLNVRTIQWAVQTFGHLKSADMTKLKASLAARAHELQEAP